jgi:hypothetical protein
MSAETRRRRAPPRHFVTWAAMTFASSSRKRFSSRAAAEAASLSFIASANFCAPKSRASVAARRNASTCRGPEEQRMRSANTGGGTRREGAARLSRAPHLSPVGRHEALQVVDLVLLRDVDDLLGPRSVPATPSREAESRAKRAHAPFSRGRPALWEDIGPTSACKRACERASECACETGTGGWTASLPG